MNHQHTLQLLHSLRLTGMADALAQQLDQPTTYEELGFFERLSLLVNSESTCRDNRKIVRLLRQAKLRLNAHPADIDYRARRGLHKDTLAQLLQLDWIRHHRNLLIEGATGTGKTFLACALGQTACEHGFSVRYFRASRLFEMLTVAHGDGSFGKLLAQLAKTELLIIDDWGLDILTQQQRNDLLEVVEDRHGRGATLITSQLPSTHWHEAIGEPTLADAILDRLLHNATKLQLKGESMRKIHHSVDPL
ncbi:IS21-like element helper ATPase IstB [Zhongshania guokunii]|jgi:DNA replication protein DnaC|uniref:IS21-like element helper ATPase IstB n=3 Tax=Zhongshania TaxID=1434050 RepID=A0ABV3U6E2_9GAMM